MLGRENARFVFHLIPNAHLDPVWLWDWREGLNEGLVTCRTILDLMDEDRELTFIRGESFIYEHIERTDPKTFARIRRQVKAGRWDVVGGTVIQPDTNLPDTETFARHLLHGQRYFRSRFGKAVKVAWAADSFGHSAGLPEILAAGGIESIAFTRPAGHIVPLEKPAFWWQGPGGSRVLAWRAPVGWYGCERDEMPKRLDGFLAEAPKWGLVNVAVFVGLGDHGGGPTRRQIADIWAWAAGHPQVKVVFSGLHGYFDALRREIARKPKGFLPTHEGELNFVLRGCYSSVAKFKFAYRKAEALLSRAERTEAAVSLLGKGKGGDASTLYSAWHALLFNSFHDILPGTSIERAFDEQLNWLGCATHAARAVEFDALNRLANRVDTTVDAPAGEDMPGPSALLVFNPHPQAYDGPIELEASLDDRPIWKYTKNVGALPVRVRDAGGKDADFQVIETEHHAMVDLAWRKRVVLNAVIPAFGWSVYQMAWDEAAPAVRKPTQGDAHSPGPGCIANESCAVRAKVGEMGLQLEREGRALLGLAGLSVVTVEDPWGSWGGIAEEPESVDCSKVRHEWKITAVEVLESGPIRAAMWVRFEGGRSRLDLTVRLVRGRDVFDICGRLFLDERSARVKLCMPAGDRATFEVPGGAVTRGPSGEVPGGRWVSIDGPGGKAGFASDAIYNFDAKDGVFRATIARASRYADDVNTPPEVEPWRAAVDSGELKFNFLLTGDVERLAMLARELEQPPVSVLVPPHTGELGKSGSLAELSPESLRILALKRAEDGDGLTLRLQETAGRLTKPKLMLFGKALSLAPIKASRIATYRLRLARNGWHATVTDAAE